jgi:hypothetical protein
VNAHAPSLLPPRRRDKRGLPGVTRDWNAPVKSGAQPALRLHARTLARTVPVRAHTHPLTRNIRTHARDGPGAPTPKESLLEYQAWKASVRKQELLMAGEPLPPDLLLPPSSAPLALEAPPASSSAEAEAASDASEGAAAAAAPSGVPRKPAPLPERAPKQRCPLRTTGVSRTQFLAALDAATAINWGTDVFAPLEAALAADDPALAAA